MKKLIALVLFSSILGCDNGGNSNYETTSPREQNPQSPPDFPATGLGECNFTSLSQKPHIAHKDLVLGSEEIKISVYTKCTKNFLNSPISVEIIEFQPTNGSTFYSYKTFDGSKVTAVALNRNIANSELHNDILRLIKDIKKDSNTLYQTRNSLKVNLEDVHISLVGYFTKSLSICPKSHLRDAAVASLRGTNYLIHFPGLSEFDHYIKKTFTSVIVDRRTGQIKGINVKTNSPRLQAHLPTQTSFRTFNNIERIFGELQIVSGGRHRDTLTPIRISSYTNECENIYDELSAADSTPSNHIVAEALNLRFPNRAQAQESLGLLSFGTEIYSDLLLNLNSFSERTKQTNPELWETINEIL